MFPLSPDCCLLVMVWHSGLTCVSLSRDRRVLSTVIVGFREPRGLSFGQFHQSRPGPGPLRLALPARPCTDG
ncbi:hypothetical protein GGR56DRAFT_643878 [Xylariaceae sp. FL0804]|nr:hypothetical protein GGR56DRAFT_643878 [Xylariaceae sp. FL0804]